MAGKRGEAHLERALAEDVSPRSHHLLVPSAEVHVVHGPRLFTLRLRLRAVASPTSLRRSRRTVVARPAERR